MEQNKRQRVTAMSTIADIEIKQINDGTLIGKLSCKYFEEPFIFVDFVDMIEMMEIVFDTKGFPEKQLLPRTFGKSGKRIKKNELDLSKAARERSRQGDGSSVFQSLACEALKEDGPSPTHNFELSVKFRHKAEWQGSLLWREKGVTSSFASIVELARLINEALINNL
ncbi:MAG: hypothetical protein FWE83_10290 [Oscillospiraceae bacterium]|nr:hypothetical protein [Oscillospiraceae bacterium]